jgi:hypothetical protein
VYRIPERVGNNRKVANPTSALHRFAIHEILHAMALQAPVCFMAREYDSLRRETEILTESGTAIGRPDQEEESDTMAGRPFSSE